jgi:Protein of unknown function (DUF723).
MASKLSQDQVINKCHIIHENKYSYDKFVYKGSRDRSIITCPIHGDFEQIIYNHLNGAGCPKCGRINTINKQSLSQEKFIQKAKEVHGDKYLYDKVKYCGMREKVTITCPIHGDFEQVIGTHLSGCGCFKCGIENRSNKRSLTLSQFIQKAKEVHGDKYLYDKVKYCGMREKVTITCPIHGDFEQVAQNHLNSGCKKCGHISGGLKQNLCVEQFIEKAKEVHGDKYLYDKVKYCGMREKVTITCPIHGDFEQLPYNHIFNESGCPSCSNNFSKPEEELRQFIQSLIPSAYKTSRGEIIPKQELDVFIPSRKIAFEFNGRYWHEHIDAEERDERKRQSCQKLGIQLHEIWENDWNNHKEKTKQKIREIIFGNKT